MSVISKNLLFLRRRAGKTQADTAFAVKVRSNTVSNWENDVSEPSASHIAAICRHFAISSDDFLFHEIEKGSAVQNAPEKAGRQDVKHLVSETSGIELQEDPLDFTLPPAAYLKKISEEIEGIRILLAELLKGKK
jgi:transcriptional regulator with XRE-family HTH domain